MIFPPSHQELAITYNQSDVPTLLSELTNINEYKMTNLLKMSNNILSILGLLNKDIDELYYNNPDWRNWCTHPDNWGTEESLKKMLNIVTIVNFDNPDFIRALYDLYYNVQFLSKILLRNYSKQNNVQSWVVYDEIIDLYYKDNANIDTLMEKYIL